MSRVLFLDPVCPSPYEARTVYTRAVGETESAVVRVAEGLAQRGHRVTVAQCGRMWPARSPGGVAYVPFDYDGGWGHLPRVDAVVVLRQHKVLPRVRRHYPGAKLALWVHRFPGSKRRALGAVAAAARATVVCVSDGHRADLLDFLQAKAGDGPAWVPTARVHLPVDDDARADGTAPDPDKLVHVAGPRGGLGEVLAAFAHVRERRPTARLFVIPTGGRAWAWPGVPAGVVPLGPLPHRAVVQHVREAFALFHPQAGIEEPFGLVFAEANAVGTPVLAHPHPTVREVLDEHAHDRRQLVDAREPEAAARRLAEWWRDGRPAVAGQDRFRTSRVAGDWERVLDLTAAVRPPVRPVRTWAAAATA